MIFVDSSAFYLLVNKNEKMHYLAKEAFNKFIYDNNELLLTSDYIIDETLTLISSRWGKHYAVTFWESISKSSILRLVKLTEKQFYKTVDLFIKYKDHKFSFTDCSSFVIMDDLKINKAFSFDKHFREFGIEVLPGIMD